MTARTAIFPSMFTPGFEFAAKKHRLVVTVARIGDLHLPSGRLVSADAIATLDFESLPRTAPPGIYPVEVCLATVAPDESRIAAVRIVFSRNPVASWELAGPGYTGPLGLFIDVDTVPALQKFIDDSPGEWWYEPPRTRGNSWEYACFKPDDDRDETCVVFQAGDGDGPFLSYWGLDATGAPASFVTDFNIIP